MLTLLHDLILDVHEAITDAPSEACEILDGEEP